MTMYFTFLTILFSFIATGCCMQMNGHGGSAEDIPQSFVLNNDQEGSFALRFDRRGQKSFDFEDFKSSSSVTMTSIAVLNAHLFSTPQDALLVYENSFGPNHAEDINVLFKHADFKVACQQDRRSVSVVEITTYNGDFYPIDLRNCAIVGLTTQDHFLLTQAQHHSRNIGN